MSGTDPRPDLALLRHLASSPPLAVGASAFLFLRHGRTAANRERRYQSPGEPLDALGRTQAAEAARVLAGCAVSRIVASPYRRTLETADAVRAGLGCPVTIDPGLAERNFGGLRGTTYITLDWAAEPEGGEPLPAFVGRVREAAVRLLATDPQDGGRPLLVAHGGTLMVLAAALGVTLEPEDRSNARPLRFQRNADGEWSAAGVSVSGAPG